MRKELETCPICKEKKLVGRHKEVCTRRNPLKWSEYNQLLYKVTRDSLGRQELVCLQEAIKKP